MIWRLDAKDPPFQGGPYWQALLDAADERDALVHGHVSTFAPALVPHVAKVVAVAARPGSTRPEVDEAAVPLARLSRMVRVHLVDAVAVYHDRHMERRRAARGMDPTWRMHPPIRPQDILARRLTREAQLDAPLRQGGRIAGLERIGRMTDAELNLQLRRFGLQRDRGEMLAEAVARASSRLVGADRPDRALVDRVMDSAEAAVSRELRQDAKEAVRDYQRARQGWNGQTVLRWVSRLSTEPPKTCPSCIDRHDTEKTLAEWQAEGMPGSPNTLCNGDCLCEMEETAANDPEETAGLDSVLA